MAAAAVGAAVPDAVAAVLDPAPLGRGSGAGVVQVGADRGRVEGRAAATATAVLGRGVAGTGDGADPRTEGARLGRPPREGASAVAVAGLEKRPLRKAADADGVARTRPGTLHTPRPPLPQASRTGVVVLCPKMDAVVRFLPPGPRGAAGVGAGTPPVQGGAVAGVVALSRVSVPPPAQAAKAAHTAVS